MTGSNLISVKHYGNEYLVFIDYSERLTLGQAVSKKDKYNFSNLRPSQGNMKWIRLS